MEQKGRRAFLSAAAGCAGICAGTGLPALAAEGPKVWTDKDKIDIGDRGKEMIQKAYQLGSEYYAKYGNCAQTSVAALQESLPFVPQDESLIMAAAPLSGSATRTRNHSCGAFSGGGLVIGSLCGRARSNFSGKAPLAGELILQIHDKYVETWGDVICNNVRTKVDSKCPDVVGKASAWTAEVLLKQFTNYKA
jgi:hypothetical protein